jgi:O-antigen ligase
MIRTLVLLSLFGYAVTTGAALTVYGAGYSNLRWVSLVAFALTGGLNWLIARQKQLHNSQISAMIVCYLALTAASIITSINAEYSTFRWGTHALMILGTAVFLRGSITADDVDKIIFFLKLLLAITMIACYLWPAPVTVFDVLEIKRGIMGNANAFGQVAAITALLFGHGYLTNPSRWQGRLEGAFGIFSAALMWSSGSRSAAILLVIGTTIIIVGYQNYIRRYTVIALISATFIILAFPRVEENLSSFALKWSDTKEFRESGIATGRAEIWAASWDGFLERPMMGWGFGADANFNLSAWVDESDAIAAKGRDGVSDLLFVMEGTGIFGLAGYLLLILVVLHARPSRQIRWYFSNTNISSLYSANSKSETHRTLARVYNNHTLCSAIVLGELACFQADNTALSAGNFLSVSFWIFLTANLVSWNCIKCMIWQSKRRFARVAGN